MKKFYQLTIIALMLASCTKPIDKRMERSDFLPTFFQIKMTHHEYSLADYQLAMDLSEGFFSKALVRGESETPETYRTLLDSARIFNIQQDLMHSMVSVRIDTAQVIPSEEIYGGYLDMDELNFKFTYINHSSKTIAKISSYIMITDRGGNPIYQALLDDKVNLAPGQSKSNFGKKYILFNDGQPRPLCPIRTPKEDMRFEFRPLVYTFDNGSKMILPD